MPEARITTLCSREEKGQEFAFCSLSFFNLAENNRNYYNMTELHHISASLKSTALGAFRPAPCYKHAVWQDNNSISRGEKGLCCPSPL
ncbi:hypothetical protein D3C79_489060 [compost metagenome]